jgi:hypothetical protein
MIYMKDNAIEKFKNQIQPKANATKLFQAWIDSDLLTEVIEQRKRDGLSWKNLIESCFKLYLDVAKGKSNGTGS